ncbi:HD domain-containing protein [Roseateles amylovorans]|uniref:N-methyl-D-aspartate receptor NMDAR2C subunit n=1 Tax=Roseateles amylovorans TaxID=2978473 RepID=A0ABY6B0Z2_9BURK|nr:N-methyl-D-aspartate receptor NMDAR2C subunit [Roseateles amylovorans]UXH78223.1 N-methyl-D-aspartate receptor NMDAR2C subunit [Roseateles amylovorans]
MTPRFVDSWTRAWTALGATGHGHDLRDTLLARYAEPQRKYHTQQHLEECLNLFDEVRDLPPHPAEVEMALWFHDAIYELRGGDNEARSAAWAEQALGAAGVARESVQRVRDLVWVTLHTREPVTLDEQVLVDIDLAILGADTTRFDEYERQICEEYAHVPGLIFRHKRRQILRRFLDRPVIYSTADLRARLEVRARGNLARAIA